MAHRRAKLTPQGRLLLVERVTVLGWMPAQAAEAAGVSRATVYKWLRRYREEGEVGLQDRPSRAHRCPHALPPSQVRRVLAARRRLKQGPHRLGPELGMARSTVYGVLRRHGLSRLHHTDRPTGTPIRYERDRPGELLHLDVKKLGRIPAGGGHRMLGRSTETRVAKGNRRLGYDYLHAAVDDHSRVAFVEPLGDERGETCAGFLERAVEFFASCGVRVEAVMTDEAMNYTRSEAFSGVLAAHGIRHKTTGPYRPRINGKVERFLRTLLEEWAYVRMYRSNGA
ncbi:MAG: IS481 family transposase, partial [Acidimicrobiia bacterium]